MKDRFRINDDGMLIIDDGGLNAQSVRMFRGNAAGGGDDGSFGNFSNLAPVDFLQCWN
jgi:hypothetical protein